MKKVFISAFLLTLGISGYTQQQFNPKNPTLDSLQTLKGEALQQKIKELENGSEQDITTLATYYVSIDKPVDDLRKLVLKRFPKGNSAFSIASQSFNEISDPLDKEKRLNELKVEFPNADHNVLIYQLAVSFVKAKNAEKAVYYAGQVQGGYRSSAVSHIAGELLEFDLKRAEEFILQQQLAANSKAEKTGLLDAYSKLMEKKGDFSKAFDSYKEVYDNTTRKRPALDARYYYLMSKKSVSEESFKGLENAVLGGAKDYRERLQLVYKDLYPNKDSGVYLAGIEKTIKDKAQNDIRSKQKKEKAPEFTVTDITGKKVSLSDYKGKTVVIDFWATWCGPCKASLPAMQTAVDKYKNDPNVKFMFIHTWENSKDPQGDATKYFAENKYDLPLFMDVRNPQTKKNDAVTAFGVKGIPAKFIIDGEGFIRFEAAGFGGSIEDAVHELSAMIELAKGNGG